LFISCCPFNTFYARGQKESIYLSSDEYYNAGIEFHNDGEYAKAIESYKKVSKCDPDYPLTCYEMALSYYYMDKYDEALAKCREALFLKYDEAIVHSLIGSILDETGKTEEGIRVLSEALNRWPYNQNILYNLAVCYLNINQPEMAEGLLFRSVICNPYHMRTHLGLAKANYMMGRRAQSYLAYNMVLLLNPTITNISAFEDAITGKEKLKPKGYLYPYPANFNSQKWDYLKELLESELAFKDEFDYNYSVSYMVARQSLMLFRKMQFDPSDTSLYNRLYVRLFSEYDYP